MKLSHVSLAMIICLLAVSAGAQDVAWTQKDGAWVATIDATYPVDADGRVEVYDLIADVMLTGSERDDVHLVYVYRAGKSMSREKAEARFDKLRPQFRTTGGDLVIEGPRNRGSWTTSRDGWTQLVMEVPRALNADVSTAGGDVRLTNLNGLIDVATAGGDIDARGSDGELVLTSSGGDLDVRRCGGTVRLTSHGGDIKLEDSEGDLRVTTSGGNSYLAGLEGSLEAASSGGTIRGQQINADHLDLTASGGDISLRKVTVDGTATLASHGGDIDLEDTAGDFELASSGGNIEALTHTGPVDVSTAGGDVELDQVNGAVHASLSAGNITLGMADTISDDSDWDIRLTNGDVTLKVPGGAGATLDAEVAHGSTSSIKSDFDLDITERRFGAVVARGEIGGGGPYVKLQLGSGQIRIVKI